MKFGPCAYFLPFPHNHLEIGSPALLGGACHPESRRAGVPSVWVALSGVTLKIPGVVLLPTIPRILANASKKSQTPEFERPPSHRPTAHKSAHPQIPSSRPSRTYYDRLGEIGFVPQSCATRTQPRPRQPRVTLLGPRRLCTKLHNDARLPFPNAIQTQPLIENWLRSANPPIRPTEL